MGILGGGTFHLFKGMRNSPRGERMRGGFNAVTLRAPTLGGAFAVWGGCFATFECTYSHLRGRHDSWNAVASGATTGGLLAARAGWKAAGRNALIGGCLLGMIEGMGIMLEKAFKQETPQQTMVAPPKEAAPPTTIQAAKPIAGELAEGVLGGDFEYEDAGHTLGDDMIFGDGGMSFGTADDDEDYDDDF